MSLDVNAEEMKDRKTALANLRAYLKEYKAIPIEYHERYCPPRQLLKRVTLSRDRRKLTFHLVGQDFTPSLNFAMGCNTFMERPDAWYVSAMYSFSLRIPKEVK